MTNKNNSLYSMSFSTGALFHHPSVMFAELYAELGDWQSVRVKVLKNNLLQSRTKNTADRVCREVLSRIKRLTPEQLLILANGSSKDQGHILWAAICKRYQFIYDFAVEVVYEKFLGMDLLLTHVDYDVFFNQKSDWHDEMERLHESTRNKLRQVVFKMLRETDLLSRRNMIIPTILSPMVQTAILDDPDLTLAIYPVEVRRTLP
jgi:hypothetical protein